MLRIARNAPIVEPMTAIHVFSETCSAGMASVVSDPKGGKGSIDADTFAFTSLALGERNGLARVRRTGVNIGLDRHAGPKLPNQGLARIEADLHGDSLNDLREVSSGVVGR